MSRSAYMRDAALKESMRRGRKPIDDPRVQEAYKAIVRLRGRVPPMNTTEILANRDRGRR